MIAAAQKNIQQAKAAVSVPDVAAFLCLKTAAITLRAVPHKARNRRSFALKNFFENFQKNI